jgi:hypothetical protein
MAVARSCYDFMRAFGGYPVNASLGVQIDPRGVLAAYETKMLEGDGRVESLSFNWSGRPGSKGGQQQQSGGDSVDAA